MYRRRIAVQSERRFDTIHTPHHYDPMDRVAAPRATKTANSLDGLNQSNRNNDRVGGGGGCLCWRNWNERVCARMSGPVMTYAETAEHNTVSISNKRTPLRRDRDKRDIRLHRRRHHYHQWRCGDPLFQQNCSTIVLHGSKSLVSVVWWRNKTSQT